MNILYNKAIPWLLVAVIMLIGLCSGCGEQDSLCSVEYPPTNEPLVSISQGIWGDVWFWTGDFQPICPTGEVTAVTREIRIHELTRYDDVEIEDFVFYYNIQTELIASVWSDSLGFFEVELEPGTYSIFVVENDMLYANSWDVQGYIFPVDVWEGEVTGIQINIDYLATY